VAQDAQRRVAIVTGASRGIGQACAVYLARAGFDLVLTARTVQEGEEREHSPTVRSSDTRPLPGSLRTTASLVKSEGGDSLVVPADLSDPVSMAAVATRAIERWGAVDVVVHNARYVGPGHMDRFLDTPAELLAAQLTANVLGPLALTRAVLPQMLVRGSGAVVNITSSVAYVDPLLPAGDGGWGMGYGITKAALHRVNGVLAAEHAGSGVDFYNVQPGVIDTERGTLEAGAFGFGGWGASPAIVGAVVAWLVSDPLGRDHQGTTVEAQFLCHQLGLLPEWPGPRPNRAQVRYDESATQLRLLEEQLAGSVQP
jgi:NAD(P)-dependent dehydrogenase (short-subunit alcohol dehydrogenase family)